MGVVRRENLANLVTRFIVSCHISETWLDVADCMGIPWQTAVTLGRFFNVEPALRKKIMHRTQKRTEYKYIYQLKNGKYMVTVWIKGVGKKYGGLHDSISAALYSRDLLLARRTAYSRRAKSEG